MSAAERREAVLEAAFAEFALHGMAGTSTEDVPAMPWRANSAIAASSTASRRSAALIRTPVCVMPAKLVTTHYLCQPLLARDHDLLGP